MLQPVLPLESSPEFVEYFARAVADSLGMVCSVCGLERIGHAPESRWLGFDVHPWHGVETDNAGIAFARELTLIAYRARAES